MKLKTYHRIIAVTLSLLMFITSTGFSMDVHFCKGQFKSFALFKEANSCHEKQKVCPMHGTVMSMDTEQDSDCCSNRSFEIEDLDEDFSLTNASAQAESSTAFIIAYLFSFFNGEIDRETSEIKVGDQPPPLLTRDIYVLNESFLL